MYFIHIIFLIGLIVSSSSVVVRRRGKPSSTPSIGGRKSDIACDSYAYKVKSRMYPHMDISPFAINGEFPHMVAIYGISLLDDDDKRFLSGGVLISADYVLSVGHITLRHTATEVRLGTVVSTTDKTKGTIIKVEKVIQYPYYRGRSKYHDISLIELSETVKFSFMILPACLYTYPYDLGDILMTSPGWGVESFSGDGLDSPLKIAEFSIYDLEECKKIYTPVISIRDGLNASHICVIDKKEETAHCQGDSGSPLQFINNENGMYTVVGISSFGKGCEPNTPTVFTNVTTYLDWIESVVWP